MYCRCSLAHKEGRTLHFIYPGRIVVDRHAVNLQLSRRIVVSQSSKSEPPTVLGVSDCTYAGKNSSDAVTLPRPRRGLSGPPSLFPTHNTDLLFKPAFEICSD